MVTVRSAVAEPGGATAWSCESDTTVKLLAGAVPNDTDVAPVKPEPMTVTVVPPALGPEGGLMPVTFGAEATVSTKACSAGTPTPFVAVMVSG